jgi:hypothetical protein
MTQPLSMPLSMQLGMQFTMQLVMPFNGKIMTFKHCGKDSLERGWGITPKGVYKQRLQFMCKKYRNAE